MIYQNHRSVLMLFVFALIVTSCSRKPVSPPAAVLPVPTAAQLQWHEMETNAFVHFTINTFTDKEWGFGDESPELFNPGNIDVDQWVTVIKNAGLKTVILTCKHHDGFCLWPSVYTDHDISASPYKSGNGDIVKDVSDACRKHGLKFGVYLSPWDRNHPKYGKPEYITYYRNQIEEIFSKYGPVFEMWFDGANGGDGYYGGTRERRTIDGSTYYDWPTTLALVKKKEPDVIFFSDAGPGVRWVGNEKGIASETNWNTISADTLYAGKPNIEKILGTGSENGTHWIPAEVDVSIRPGWFYHSSEDDKVKTPEQLFDIYLTSVGRGSTLLLNIPPDKRGRIHEKDVKSLSRWREMIDSTFANDLARDKKVIASAVRGNSSAFAEKNINDGNAETYWATDDGVTTGYIEIDFDNETRINYITLQEYIRLGQRVKAFNIDIWKDNQWQRIATGTTIGYKRIIPIKPVSATKLRINITDGKACPLISTVSVY
jgi:alpha-L-fucosidase